MSIYTQIKPFLFINSPVRRKGFGIFPHREDGGSLVASGILRCSCELLAVTTVYPLMDLWRKRRFPIHVTKTLFMPQTPFFYFLTLLPKGFILLACFMDVHLDYIWWFLVSFAFCIFLLYKYYSADYFPSFFVCQTCELELMIQSPIYLFSCLKCGIKGPKYLLQSNLIYFHSIKDICSIIKHKTSLRQPPAGDSAEDRWKVLIHAPSRGGTFVLGYVSRYLVRGTGKSCSGAPLAARYAGTENAAWLFTSPVVGSMLTGAFFFSTTRPKRATNAMVSDAIPTERPLFYPWRTDLDSLCASLASAAQQFCRSHLPTGKSSS